MKIKLRNHKKEFRKTSSWKPLEKEIVDVEHLKLISPLKTLIKAFRSLKTHFKTLLEKHNQNNEILDWNPKEKLSLNTQHKE